MDDLIPHAHTLLSMTSLRWLSLTTTLPQDLLECKPAASEWSALECLWHLLVNERSLPVWVRNVLTGEPPAHVDGTPRGYHWRDGRRWSWPRRSRTSGGRISPCSVRWHPPICGAPLWVGTATTSVWRRRCTCGWHTPSSTRCRQSAARCSRSLPAGRTERGSSALHSHAIGFLAAERLLPMGRPAVRGRSNGASIPTAVQQVRAPNNPDEQETALDQLCAIIGPLIAG